MSRISVGSRSGEVREKILSRRQREIAESEADGRECIERMESIEDGSLDAFEARVWRSEAMQSSI